MELTGNVIDLVIIIFVAIYVLGRFKKGFIQGVVDLAGFLLSLLFALRFYYLPASFLSTQFNLPKGISSAAGFFIMAFVGEIALILLSAFLFRFIPKRILESKINTRLSFVPATISSFILVAFFVTTAIVLPVRPDIKQAINSSKIGGNLAKQTIGLERSINKVFGGAIEEALTFMTIKPQSDETINLNFTTTDFSPDPESEREMLRLLNIERTKKGLPSLKVNEPMRRVARAHCADMFERGYFSHYTPDGLSPFDRMEQAGIEYRAAGENLAYAPDVEIAHDGLMNSPGHRANILSENFGQVGIGVMNAGIYGRMFCQEFRD